MYSELLGSKSPLMNGMGISTRRNLPNHRIPDATCPRPPQHERTFKVDTNEEDGVSMPSWVWPSLALPSSSAPPSSHPPSWLRPVVRGTWLRGRMQSSLSRRVVQMQLLEPGGKVSLDGRKRAGGGRLTAVGAALRGLLALAFGLAAFFAAGALVAFLGAAAFFAPAAAFLGAAFFWRRGQYVLRREEQHEDTPSRQPWVWRQLSLGQPRHRFWRQVS